MEDVLVTVLIIAFNQEKYIRKALKGVVEQVTNFKFEVIAHDDASTDNTASIIREFEQKYPDIIKGYYEEENQYSKHNLKNVLCQHVKGKYIAICEGDDYWVNPHKLQIQVDFLEKHKEYNSCHGITKLYDVVHESFCGAMPHISFDKKFTIKRIMKNGLPFQTSSMLMRSFLYLAKDSPYYYLGDGGYYYSSALLAKSGGVWCFAKVFSVSNRFVENSWTMKHAHNLDLMKNVYKKNIEAHQKALQYYDKKNKKNIEYCLRWNEYHLLLLEGNYAMAYSNKYRDVRKSIKKGNLKRFLKERFPFLVKIRNAIKF